MQFWCSHTFLSVPLETVLENMRSFIEEYPSEVIIVKVKPDKHPVNADKAFLARKSSQTFNLNKRDNADLLHYILDKVGDKVMRDFRPEMKVS
mmetsp:Transcript_44159/g.42890  ORF Transcript_44159/g.42890 Transcript_44159/m.42890 type:complete len:93 (+) Transcript_44159:474-752(+)